MLSALLLHPQLRCTAKSRRSGWQQCGRIACTGLTVCWTHGGARKKNRWGKNAPNYKHGKRSLEATTQATHAFRRLQVLAIGLRFVNGDQRVASEFFKAWFPLLERQEKELAALRGKMGKK